MAHEEQDCKDQEAAQQERDRMDHEVQLARQAELELQAEELKRSTILSGNPDVLTQFKEK